MDNTEYDSRLRHVTMKLQLPCEIITTRLHDKKRQHHQPNSCIHILFMQPTVPYGYLRICPSISCCFEQQCQAFSSLFVKETALLAVQQPIFNMYWKIDVTHLTHSECLAEISLRKKTCLSIHLQSNFQVLTISFSALNLSVLSEVQMICMWSSWCHCLLIISCFSKIQIPEWF